MGPFHLIGHWLGAPAWIIQRSWMAVVLVTGFLGVVRLATRLDLGTPTARLLSGLAYALSPRVLTELGGNSAELWPTVVLPWVLLPLVGVRAQERPRRAAALSGVAVLCMGAANATTVLALLPLPALWLLPGLRHATGRRLAAWWAVCVALACAWWFVPLVLQGRYSSNFLDYIESARITTRVTSPAEVLRGTSHWLGFLAPAGSPWWRSGWLLVTSGFIIVNTAVLSTLGVVGLLRRRMPGQGRLVLAAAVGLLAMSAAHVGPLSGPAAHTLQQALDGALAPFRNVHKFDGLIRLPLALGLCHLLGQATSRRLRQSLSGLVVLVLIGASTPALAGQLVPAGHYASIPGYWKDAGTWLDQHNATGHALVVPASGFGEYLWGRPLDNPLQALTRSPWVVRDAVPLGSAGNTRLLDAIEARLETGQGSPALQQVLVRMGVTHLVVAGDLDPFRTGAPRAALIQQALDETPGVQVAASFGPQLGGQGTDRSLVDDDGLSVGLPALVIYEVSATESPVVSLPTAQAWSLTGGPEGLFQLADRGLLSGRAVILAGDGSAGPSPRTVLTDSLRRREIDFGAVRHNASATLSRDAPLLQQRPVADVLPVPGREHLATSRLLGAQALTASSSASEVGSLFHRDPVNQPSAAFDADPRTSWISASSSGASRQWLQINLDTPVDPTGTTIRMARAGSGVPTAVTVHTDAGDATTELVPGTGQQRLAVSPGPTRRLRVTATSVRQDGAGSQLAVSELSIPGVTVAQTLDLASDQAQRPGSRVLLDRATGAAGGCLRSAERSVCSPALGALGEDTAALDRSFSLDAGQRAPLTGTALPVPGPALNALLDEGAAVQVTASSQLVPDPPVRPGSVVDQDVRTGWIAGTEDVTPSLTMSWKGLRQVSSVHLVTDPGLVAARPTRVLVVTSAGQTVLRVPADGVLRFPTARTDQLTLWFLDRELRTSFGRDGGIHRVPVGLSEVTVPGLGTLQGSPPPATASVGVPCGKGPAVVVDGSGHPTALLGTRQDLLDLRPLLLSVCDTPQGLLLGAGRHRVVARGRGAFAVQGLEIGPAPSLPPVSRPVVVRQWENERRVVSVGPGEQSYLVVQENANRGWQATLNGVRLPTARIDGWQQAWVVPAGAGGQVSMVFVPGRSFRIGLAVGAGLLLVLALLALVPARTSRRAVPARGRDLPVPLRVAAGMTVLVLLGGSVAAALGAVLLLGAEVVRRLRRFDPHDLLVAVCGVSLLLAGLLTAISPWNGPRPPAAFGKPVAALVLGALAAAVAALSGPRSPSAASGPAPVAPPDEGSAPRPPG